MLVPMLCMCRLGSNQEELDQATKEITHVIKVTSVAGGWREKANVAQFVSAMPRPHVVFAGRGLPLTCKNPEENVVVRAKITFIPPVRPPRPHPSEMN